MQKGIDVGSSSSPAPLDARLNCGSAPALSRLEYAVQQLYSCIMPDELYDRDVLAWSERQARLLCRVAGEERVSDVDWAHVVEEIKDVGLSELNAVQSHLRQISWCTCLNSTDGRP